MSAGPLTFGLRLFNDDIVSEGSVAFNVWWIMNWKGCGRKRKSYYLRYCSGNYFGWRGKTRKTPIKLCGLQRDLNLGPAQWVEVVLLAEWDNLCVCVFHCACVSRYSATIISSNVITQNSSLVVTTMSDEITGHKVKVQFTLEQATKAQRGRRGIAPLFL